MRRIGLVLTLTVTLALCTTATARATTLDRECLLASCLSR